MRQLEINEIDAVEGAGSLVAAAGAWVGGVSGLQLPASQLALLRAFRSTT